MNSFLKSNIFLLGLILIPFMLKAQQQGLAGGTVRGNFQLDVQTYQEDKDIGITDSTINGKKAAMNAFGKIIYTNGNFSAGMRFEAYLKPLNGFEADYDGIGIPYRFARYKSKFADITVGNFYEQFGSGLIFRSYQEWNLGYDNSVDGIRAIINPLPGIKIKGIYGSQRYYWEKYGDSDRGIIRGLDAEFSLNDLIPGMEESMSRILLGASMLSKYQKDDPTFKYKLPENVSAYAGRLNFSRGGFNLMTEYAYKINDPSAFNNYIYKHGEALFISTSYSQKGLGITLSAKRIDNMSFKSDRAIERNALDINFLPPITKQHTYTLLSFYPYASQPNGEMDLQAELIYTLPRKSALGGKYGTNIILNYSVANSIERTAVNDTTLIGQKGTEGYKSDFFSLGDELFFRDFSVEIRKKFSSKFKMIAEYMNQKYNQDVLEGHGGMISANIAALDLSYKFTPKKSLRTELQFLSTDQDLGKWGLILFEYTIAPRWFFTIQDQYNFDRPDKEDPIHYYYGAIGYVHNTNRIAFSWGRQREGLLCVGGVCRQVPASSGFTITITSSF